MSIALARKYRPKRFADVAVQSHVSGTLKGAIARGRVAHGYLLCGPRGVGKTTLARVLAMALNCERLTEQRRLARGDSDVGDAGGAGDTGIDGEPCGECQSCRRIWSGAASLDVVEIDAASNRGVDDARELRERAMYAPSGEDHYKVYIVDEAHMLTREAWNALLKILEEPPPRVVFVFATTEPHKIAQTAAPVLSRLQRFDFKRIGPAEVRERLTTVLAEEGIAAEPEALVAIARAADGSMRDALSLADQVLSMGDGGVTAERVRDALGLVPEDEFIAIFDIVAERRAADVFPAVGRLAEAGIDFGGFLTGLADLLRAQLAVVLGGVAGELSERGQQALEKRKERFSPADLLRMLSAISELEPRFRKSGQQQLLIETLLVRFALLDRSVEIEDVLRSLGGDGGSSRGRSDHAAGDRPATSRPGAAPSRQAAAASTAASAPASAPARAEPRPSTRADAPSASAAEARASGAIVGNTERAPAPVASPAPSPAPSPAGQPESAPDLNAVVGRWDTLVERVRADGKPLLGTALEHSTPTVVTARGDLTVELEEPNDFFARAILDGRTEVLAILREWFPGLARVDLRREESPAAAPPRRLTDEMVRAERLNALRKRDPVLGAAIDALDLDVAD